MAWKLLLFQVTVTYVKTVAPSIMSSFMIYNVPNITHITEIKRRKMGGVRNVAFMRRKLAKQPLGRPRQRLDDTNKRSLKQ
jgi:hypothetical protein